MGNIVLKCPNCPNGEMCQYRFSFGSRLNKDKCRCNNDACKFEHWIVNSKAEDDDETYTESDPTTDSDLSIVEDDWPHFGKCPRCKEGVLIKSGAHWSQTPRGNLVTAEWYRCRNGACQLRTWMTKPPEPYYETEEEEEHWKKLGHTIQDIYSLSYAAQYGVAKAALYNMSNKAVYCG